MLLKQILNLFFYRKKNFNSKNYKMWKLEWPQAALNTELSSLERSSHTINILNDKLYVLGGEHDPRIPIDNDLHVYNLATHTWSIAEVKSKHRPNARLGHASCVLNNKLYVFGGRTGVDMGEHSLNDLHVYDLDSQTWTELVTNEKSQTSPPQRSFHAMASLKNKLYVFGGCSVDHGRLNDLFEYDLALNKWTQLESDDRIHARGGASLCAYESSDPTSQGKIKHQFSKLSF